jgi:Eukaryotic protein of unknown function (DUF953)
MENMDDGEVPRETMSKARKMDLTLVPDPDNLEVVWKNITSRHEAPETIFLLCIAELDETGKYWCPHCAEAAPVLNEALVGRRVVECSVRREAYRGNPDYPLRNSAIAQLSAIPQLNKYTKHADGDYRLDGKLVGDQCKAPSQVRKFVSPPRE